MNDLTNYAYRGAQDCPIAFYDMNVNKLHLTKYPHRHPDVELLLLRQGSLTVLLNKKAYFLKPGQILIIEPNAVHELKNQSPDAKWYHLYFSQEAVALPESHIFQKAFLQPLYAGKLRLPRLLQPEHPAYPEVLEQMNKLALCSMNIEGYKLRRFSIVVSICTILAPYCVSNNIVMTDKLPQNAAVRRIVLYIHNHLSEELTLSMLSTLVYLHPNYLCMLFKKHMGESIIQYITRKRVEHAATLLRTENLSVSQAAEKAGFGSDSMFFQKFREYMGTTPHDYARQFRSK